MIYSVLQGGCAWFAYQRFKQGFDAAFAPTYESDPTANAYSSYPVGNEPEQYNEPPFGQQQQQRGKSLFSTSIAHTSSTSLSGVS